MIYTVSNY